VVLGIFRYSSDLPGKGYVVHFLAVFAEIFAVKAVFFTQIGGDFGGVGIDNFKYTRLNLGGISFATVWASDGTVGLHC
jgi:hypothetical protein